MKTKWIRDYWDEKQEEYDKREAERKKENDEFYAKYPSLKNLMWVDGEMYYTDDDGNRLSDVDTKAQLNNIKDQIRDCFIEVSPKEPLLVSKLDPNTLEVTCTEEVDRLSMLDEELDKTKFNRNNARAFIENIEEER